MVNNLVLSMSVLITILCPPAPASPPDAPYEEAICFDRNGTSLDLRTSEVYLSNVREVGGLYYTIQGDKVTVSNRRGQREGVRIYDAFFLTDAGSRSSLVLFHADFAGRPYIYWIEKRGGDLSRNGLLEINGDRITRGCVGTIWR